MADGVDCVTELEGFLDPTLFKALCDPSRLALVARLATTTDAMTVSEASGCCGVHISGASRHLAMLRDAGVVSSARHGREVRYRLAHDNLVSLLRGLADCLERCGQLTKEKME